MQQLRPNIIKKIAPLWLSILAASVCFADTSYKEMLAQVAPPELPAKAAGLIKETKASERERVTLDVTKIAVELNPAAATAIVTAIVRAAPEMAGPAAAVAAAEQPKQAAAIARAAAIAAPVRAGKIVMAVCRAAPRAYREIAVAVAKAVPGSDKELLNAVAIALPELKLSLDSVLGAQGGSPPSVAGPAVAPPVSRTNQAPASTAAKEQSGTN